MIVDSVAQHDAQVAFDAFVKDCAGDPELVQEVVFYRGIPVHGGCLDPAHIIPALVQSLSDVNPWALEKIAASYPALVRGLARADRFAGPDMDACQAALLGALNDNAPPGFRFSAHPCYPDLIGWFSELLYLDPSAFSA